MTLHFAGSPRHPALFLLHGFLGCKEDFAPLLPRLAQHFYCVAVDLPGHGEAVQIRRSWAEMAEYLVEIQARYAPNQPSYLYGYSLGGRIALYTALHFPRSWQKVVLVSASAGLAEEAQRAERRRWDGAIARKLRQEDLDFGEFLQSWYRQEIFRGLGATANFDKLLQRRQLENPSALADVLENFSLGHQPYLGNLLSRNTLPLLLLAGELDPKFVAIQSELAMLCPAAQVKILAECSHNLQFQQPHQLLELVSSWLHTNSLAP